MVTALAAARLPVRANSPALTVRVPVWVQVDVTSMRPAPVFVMAPPPPMGPLRTKSLAAAPLATVKAQVPVAVSVHETVVGSLEALTVKMLLFPVRERRSLPPLKVPPVAHTSST